MARFSTANDTRALVWSYLVVCPGKTAHEIARGALGRRGPTGASISGAGPLCQRMERDGQLLSRREFRPQQGREVTLWYAVPGAFAVADEAQAQECRIHGQVSDDHFPCRRPGESAMEFTSRALGETRDV